MQIQQLLYRTRLIEFHQDDINFKIQGFKKRRGEKEGLCQNLAPNSY